MYLRFLPVLLLLSFYAEGSKSSDRNSSWYQGCYATHNKDGLIQIQNATILNRTAEGPAYCTWLCTKHKFNFAGLHNGSNCLCLNNISGISRINNSECSLVCPNETYVPCGGHIATSVYSTTQPVIFNGFLTGNTSVLVTNLTIFNAGAWQSKNVNIGRGKIASKPSYSPSFSWTVDDISVKKKLKASSERANSFSQMVSDTLSYTFKSLGEHRVCVNISNPLSWSTKCLSVLVIEPLHSLKVVGLSGGKTISTGHYVLVKGLPLEVNITINAGSFAETIFDFENGSYIHKVKSNHKSIGEQNCTYMLLVSTGHIYTERGLYSLKVTAANAVGQKEAYLTDRFIVQGKITSAKISKRFVTVGMSAVNVDTTGDARDANYTWYFQNRIHSTTIVPRVIMNFPISLPQYRVKVDVYNLVSKVSTEERIFIQPTITNISFTAIPHITETNRDIQFRVTITKSWYQFGTSIKFKFHLGERISGPIQSSDLTMNPTFQYTRSGRYKTFVYAYNEVSNITSEKVEIMVYEAISMLSVSYRPFLYGEATEFVATIQKGSNVTYVWDFGDSSTLTTDSNTVKHLFQGSQKYHVRVTASNLIGKQTASLELFVTKYACGNPIVTILGTDTEREILHSNQLRLDVDVIVNCTVTSHTLYHWEAYSATTNAKISPASLNLDPEVFREKNLRIPGFHLRYGNYKFRLKVTMNSTIVHTIVEKPVKVVPTGLRPVIFGGTWRLIGRKNTQNVTLDAKHSFDPDDRDGSEINEFKFSWTCASINSTHHGPCFKPNKTKHFDWNSPVIQFPPSILRLHTDLFAFKLVVKKDGQADVTATQFLKIEEKSNMIVSIECPQCKDVDVGPQQDLRFIGKCETCPPDKGTYSFSWKVYFAKMESVFLKEFGKCFKPDGSSWKGAAAFTHTTTAPNPMTKPPPRPEYKKRRQVVVCEEELRVLFDQSFVSNSFGGVRAKRSILDHYELDNEVEYTSRAAAVQKLDSPNNGELNVAERIRRDAGSNSGSNTSVSSPLPTAKGTTTSTTSTTRTTATNAATAAAEATTQMTGATTATTTSTSAATATTATTTAMTATTTTTGRTKKGTGATTETTSATTTTARVTTTGTPSAESTSTTALNSVNTGGGSSVGSGGRGGTSVDGGSSRRGVGRASGRRANRRVVPEQGNTRRTSPRGRATGGGGSQPGCISSQGNSRGSGSGRGSTSTNCVCFGCGAKNTTGGSGGGGGNSITPTPSPKGKELDDLHKVIERYMHPAKIGSQQTVGGFDKNDLVIKANSLVPGQQYMVELTTYRHSESNKTVSGISRLYFVTNTGPWKGTCKVIPQSGYEIDTIFRFKCENWKDMHYPLTFKAKYRMPHSRRYSLVYSGFESEFKFTLAAGDKSKNYIVDIFITIGDTTGTTTELCPLKVKVLPMPVKNETSIEEILYNKTHKPGNIFWIYEQTSDITEAISAALTVSNTLNRLPWVSRSSIRHQLRQETRKRLLESLSMFNTRDLVLTHQLCTVVRDATKVPNESAPLEVKTGSLCLLEDNKEIFAMSFAAIGYALKVMEKLKDSVQYKRKDRTLRISMEFVKDTFEVVSQLLEATGLHNVSKPVKNKIKLAVTKTLGVKDEIIKTKQDEIKEFGAFRTFTLSTSQVSTKAILQGSAPGSISIAHNGALFILSKEAERVAEKASTNTSCLRSLSSVFEKNPFTYGDNSTSIQSKVASLDFLDCNGKPIQISNLSDPIDVTIPVKSLQLIEGQYKVEMNKFNVHMFNITEDHLSSSLFITVKEIDARVDDLRHKLKVVIRFNEPPTKLVYNHTLKFSDDEAKFFLPKEKLPGTGRCYIGFFITTIGHLRKKIRYQPWFKYKLNIHWSRCVYWNEKKEFWSDEGCFATKNSTTEKIVCSCNHLTAFGGVILQSPNEITVKSIQEFKKLEENELALILVLLAFCMYLLLLVYCHNDENNKKETKTIVNLPDNHPADLFRYLVAVDTGCSIDAGTTSRVSIIVYGDQGHSQHRELTCFDMKMFQRGSTNCIMISCPESLGNLQKIRVWHSNTGESPSWFLKKVTIIDERTGRAWYFNFSNWLAVDRGTGRVNCELKAEDRPHLSFVQMSCEGLLDYHLWLSVLTKPSRNSFTKSQRLTCCLSTLLAYMCVSAAWFKQSSSTQDIFGILDFSWTSFHTSLIACGIVVPVHLFIIFLFRTSKKREQRDSDESVEEASYVEEGFDEGLGAIYYNNVQMKAYGSEDSGIEPLEFIITSEKFVGASDSLDDIISGECIHKDPAAGGISLPEWCRGIAWILCIVTAFGSAVLTLLYGISFGTQKTLAWAQTLLFSLIQNIFIIEVLVVVLLVIRRLYCLYSGFDARKYLNEIRLVCLDDYDWQNPEKVVQEEFNEKKILASRDRARYIRHSKPLHGKKLEKARRVTLRQKDLHLFLRDLFLCSVYFMALTMILFTERVDPKYHKANTIKCKILRTNFTNITTVAEFWKWTETGLISLLDWEPWHVGLYKHVYVPEEASATLYLFGPVRMMQTVNVNKKLEKTITPSNSAPLVKSSTKSGSNNSSFANRTEGRSKGTNFTRVQQQSTKKGPFKKAPSMVLLVGTTDRTLPEINNLRRLNWTSPATKAIYVEYSYYDPMYNLFSYVTLTVDFPSTGKISPALSVKTVELHRPWTALEVWLVICKILFLACIFYSLRKEFCSLMDHSLGHFRNIWRLIEGLLIFTTIFGLVVYVCWSVAIRSALQKSRHMDFDDKKIFLDLNSVIIWEKILNFVYATLILLSTIRCLRILRVVNLFNQLFLALGFGLKKLRVYLLVGSLPRLNLSASCGEPYTLSGYSFQLDVYTPPVKVKLSKIRKVVIVIVLVAFAHSGTLFFDSVSWYFKSLGYSFTSLWVNFRRGHNPYWTSNLQIEEPVFSRLYHIGSIIGLLVLWRISSALFLGNFKKAKLKKQRKIKIMKSLIDKLHAARKEKPWKKFWKTLRRRKKDPYQPIHLPVENAYGELEDQVEEMIFRINNLLNIHNMPDRYDSDEESSNLETSEAGAYPSSFSTTDSISYTSDSVYTEDSGYNNRSYEFSPDDGGSGSIGPDTAEGKYSFGSNDWTVRNETPKLGDSGQFLSPIFGGRYFVKASWSTFRPPPPHITPALLQPRNIIQVKPLESKSEKTLEKLKNWSSRQGARRLSMELTDTDSSENLPDFSLLKMETGRDKMPAFTENSFSKRTASLVTLPPKLPSEPKVSPFRQPAPLPTIDEIMKKHRKKNLFKRPRVESLGSDGSSATSSGSNYHCGSLSKNGRCPSLDSGIVKSSEAEDTEGETPVASDNNLSHSNASRTLRTQGKQFGSNSIKYVL